MYVSIGIIHELGKTHARQNEDTVTALYLGVIATVYAGPHPSLTLLRVIGTYLLWFLIVIIQYDC